MKRILFISALCAFSVVGVQAQEVMIGGLKYHLRSDVHEAIVSDGMNWEGTLTIPTVVNYEDQDYEVTMIESLAFHDCKTLTSVTIPATVREICHFAFNDEIKNAFDGCTSLEGIEVDKDNQWMCSLDGVLYSRDTTKLFAYPGGAKEVSYQVPDKVTWTGANAFSGNPYLERISYPNTVRRVCYGAFRGCTNLQHVKLPEGLTYLSAYLFRDCTSLKSIDIPQGVKGMAEQVFFGCSSLIEVTLPEGVNSVGSLTFRDCSSLRKVILPSSLLEVSHGMFSGCGSLTDITLNEGPKTIYMSAFADCTSLKTIDLPKSVNRIDPVAFEGCSLDTLIIRGVLDRNFLSERSFEGMGNSTIIYARQSEIDKIKKVYSGEVLPLDSYTAIHDLSAPEMVNGQSSNGKWYDLSGRRIGDGQWKMDNGQLPRGVYIRDGKKVLVK